MSQSLDNEIRERNAQRTSVRCDEIVEAMQCRRDQVDCCVRANPLNAPTSRAELGFRSPLGHFPAMIDSRRSILILLCSPLNCFLYLPGVFC